MMALVILQIHAAGKVKWLTVEQLVENAQHGLSFDRHFAMPFDLVVIAPFIGLVSFLCFSMWEGGDMMKAASMSAVASVALVVFWYNLPGKEAHNQSLEVAIYHGIFLAIALWAIIMVDVFTTRPEPAVLLMLCIVLPAFLFVGTHMYLGLINWDAAAWTYTGNPLKDPVGWTILITATAVQIWRTWVLIPPSFWDSIR
jgi:drug/metabolite transporter superfamily protein YnfA